MTSLGLHAVIPLTHAWPQRLSLVSEEDSITPFCILNSKIRAMWQKLPSSTAYLGWNMVPAFSYICISFLFSMVSFLPNFGYLGAQTLDQAGLTLRDPVAFVSKMLGLKVCTMTANSKFFFNFFSQIGNLAV